MQVERLLDLVAHHGNVYNMVQRIVGAMLTELPHDLYISPADEIIQFLRVLIRISHLPSFFW